MQNELAWNDEDLDNIPMNGLDKIVGEARGNFILFYGCGKAIDEAQVILSR
jgi:hypothetical protein